MKLLLLDIETSPSVGYTWGPKWETSIIEFIEERQILCFAYKWIEGHATQCLSVKDYRDGEKGLLKALWALLDEAEIVVAQNGDAFDIRVINARLIAHGMLPPSPYKTIDTYKVAKGRFSLNSYKLDDLGKYLNEGEKIKHRGFDMWKGCMAGVPKDWRDMKNYNKQDVDLLEKIYLRLRPWIKGHPSVEGGCVCPYCGEGRLQKRGYIMNRAFRFQRYQCQDCGGWSKSTKDGIPMGSRQPV